MNYFAFRSITVSKSLFAPQQRGDLDRPNPFAYCCLYGPQLTDEVLIFKKNIDKFINTIKQVGFSLLDNHFIHLRIRKKT
jgi:hypothetical protein